MANEISINYNLQLNKGRQKLSINPDNMNVTQNGVGADQPTFTVATTEADLTFPNVTTPGILVFQNLDENNNVRWWPKDSTGKSLGIIRPGEITHIRLNPGTIITAIAENAQVKLQAYLLED